MEQIKEFIFRGRSKHSKKWIEGSLLNTIDDVMINARLEFWAVEPETVGQYIWRTDKNGKKVFDGDIIRYDDIDPDGSPFTDVLLIKFSGEVKTNDGKYVSGYVCQSLEFEFPDVEMLSPEAFSENVTVIGNRFDNPELLEVRHGK